MKTFKYLLMQALFFACFCALFAFANPFLSSKNFSITQIGLLITLSSIFSVISQPYITKCIEKYKKFTVKKSILLLTYLTIFSLLIILISNNTFILFLCYVIALGCIMSIQTFMYPFIFEYIDEGYKVNFGFARGMGSVTYAIVSLTLGFFSKKSLNFLPAFCFITSFALLLVVYSFKNLENKTISNNNLENETISFKEFYKKNKSFCYILLGCTLLFYTHSALNTYLKNIMEYINYGTYEVGVCYMLSSIIEFPVMTAVPYLHKKFSYNFLFAISAIGFTTKCFFVMLGTLFKSISIIYFAQFFQIFGFALYLPVSLYYISTVLDKKDVTKAQAYLGIGITLGGILGNYISAYIFQSLSIFYFLTSCFIITFIGTLFITTNTKKS